MRFFLNKTITVRRLIQKDINRSVFSATGTADGYFASVQEPRPDRIQMYGGQIGNVFECYVEEDCPADDGDQVVKDGVKYSVQNVKVMDFGVQHYKRLTIVKRPS